MPEQAGPNVRQRRVARTLRSWRKSKGATLEAIAIQLRWSESKLSRFERADTIAGPAEIIAVAAVLGIDDAERDQTVSLAVASFENEGWWRSYGPEAVRGDFEDYVETEAEATAVRTVETMLVPGLLQTSAYADALVRAWLHESDDHLVEQRSRLRRERQSRLDEASTPLHLHAIVHETALTLPIGGADIMREQTEHLLTRAQLSNVVLQVLPASVGAYPGIGTSYHLVNFGPGDAAAVYLENLNDGLYVEDDGDLDAYTLNFERLTELALDPEASAQRIGEVWKSTT